MKEKGFSKDFIMVVIGQIISLFGNAALRFALPLYLLNQTGSSALYGTVTACAFLPSIAMSPIGGIVADRVNKRNIMVALDFFDSSGCWRTCGLPSVWKRGAADCADTDDFIWNCRSISAVCAGSYPSACQTGEGDECNFYY